MSNLLLILAAITDRRVEEVAKDFDGRGYGHLKVAVAEAVVAFATPFARRTAELLDDPAELDSILARGASRAAEVADVTLANVYDLVGFLRPAT